MARYGRIALFLASLANLFGAAQAGRRDTVITVLHTNDLHGSVLPCNSEGGLARIATVIRQVRSEMPNVLLLDTGDIIHGTPEDYFSGGRASISAMNAAGYDLASTGNHDYDYGLDTTQNAISFASFPFVAANVRSASGGQWDGVGQYKVFTIGGVRVGVLGLTTLETVSLHWPGSIKDIVVDDPITTAKTIVPKVKSESDILIVLSHLGVDQDQKLAKEVSGIDFVIGGHTHTVLSKLMCVGDTLIAQAGAYGRELGRIDFIVQKNSDSAKIISVNGVGCQWNRLKNTPLNKKYPQKALIHINNRICEDEAVKAAYMPFRIDSEKRLSEVISCSKSKIVGYGVEPPAANLVADAVRAFANSDIALIDIKSVSHCGLPAGPLTVRSAFNLINGFTRQSIVVGRVSGNDLTSILTGAISSKAISGASIEYQSSKGKATITKLLIGDKPLDPQGYYTIASQAYVMMNIMKAIPNIEIVAEPRETTREALINYFKSQKTILPPSTGRMIRVD